ncbi:MAG: phage tail protein [Terrimicrobiaceae bacterium]
MKLVGDIGGFQTSMASAEKTASSASSSIGDKLGSIGKAAGIVAGAGIAALSAGLLMSVKEASDSQQGLAQLDAALKSTAAAHEAAGTKTVWMADAVNKLAGQTVTLTSKTDSLAGASKKHLAEIAAAPEKLETATARLNDMEAAYAKAKTHTESSTLALQRQREAVGSLTALVAEGTNRYTESNSVVAATSGHWEKVTASTQVARETILALADSIQKTTKFADDDVIAASSMMLTFTNIGKDVFPNAIKTTMDMAQALGQDATQSAMQLGKALNDPVAGVTALQRVGVKLSEDQKKQVEGFMKVNDVASAQNVILKELQTEFGGSAEAAGATFAGKMAILGHGIDDVKEGIGTALLPMLTNLATGLATALADPATQTGITNLATGIGTIAGTLSTGIGAVLTFVTALTTGLSSGGDPFGVIVNSVYNFLTALGMGQGEAASWAVGIGTFVTDAVAFFNNLVAWVQANWPTIQTTIVNAFNQVSAVVTPIVNGIIAALTAVVTWVVTNWPQIQSVITIVFETARSIIEPIINAIASVITTVFTTIKTFLQDHGTEIQAFVAGAWEKIQSIISGIASVITIIWTWASGIITTVLNGIAKFISDNQEQIQLGITMAWNGIKLAISTVLTIIDGVIQTFLSILKGDWQGAWNAILKTAENVWQNIKDFFNGIPTQLTDIGKSIIDGIVKGFTDAKSKVEEALSKIIMDAIQKIKDLLGIKSPSTVFAGMGENMMRGLANGITGFGALPQVELNGVIGGITGGATSQVAAGITPAYGGINSGGDTHVHVHLDGDEIARYTINRFTGEAYNSRQYVYGAQ